MEASMFRKSVEWKSVAEPPTHYEDTVLVLWRYKDSVGKYPGKVFYGFDEYDYKGEEEEGELEFKLNFVDGINGTAERRNRELGREIYKLEKKEDVEIVYWAYLPEIPEECLLEELEAEYKELESQRVDLATSTDYFTEAQSERYAAICGRARDLECQIKELKRKC